MNNFGIYPNFIKKIKDVFSKFPSVKKVYIFGSRAKNTAKNGESILL